MKKLFIFFSLGLFALLGALVGAPQANAASAYDDIVTNAIPPYTINNYTNSRSKSFANSFEIGEFLGNANPSASAGFCGVVPTQDYDDAMQAIIDNNFYFISIASQNGATTREYYLVVGVELDANSALTVSWITNQLTVNSPTMLFFTVRMDGTTTPRICADSGQPIATYSSYTPHRGTMPIETNIDIEYPQDYEGAIIPVVTPPLPSVDYAPNWYVSNIIDNKGKFHDMNFNTVDGSPFLCEGDLAPVLHYEIWRNTSPQVFVTSGTQSATAEINYDFGSANEEREYEIVGWYDCGGTYNFTEQGRKFFTITKMGTLYRIGLETCVTENFPFLSWESCTVGINDMLSILMFNALNPSDSNIGTVANNNPNNCHNLGTLGDWLNQDNATVCPAFSSEVRNTVTPFITFILGGLIFYWVTRGKGVVVN